MSRIAGTVGLVLVCCVALASCGLNNGGAAPIQVIITNKIVTIAPGAAAVTVNAEVFNDPSVAGVTFKITANGMGCQPACGTLTNASKFAVQYTPPPSIPGSPNNKPTITATSVADTAEFDTDAFTIQASVSNVALMKGQYQFLVTGFDKSGFPLSIAGSFAADGAGDITGGEMDVNDDGAIGGNSSTLMGSYTLDGNLRGIITFTNAVTQLANPPAFSFTVDSTGSSGDLISLDTNELALSGFLQIQQSVPPVPAPPGAPPGGYVFRVASDDPERSAGVGRFTVQADGTISNGLIDTADVVNGNDLSDELMTGMSTAADSDGRGTLTLTPNSGGAVKFAYYEVTPNKIYLLEIDPGAAGTVSVFGGEARTQTVPFAGSADNGTSAFGLLGGDFVEVNGAPFAVSSATIGQIVINGASATVTSDLNDSSVVGTSVVSDGNVAFDLTTGRGTITFPDGFSRDFVDSVVFYLDATGEGVMMDTTATTASTFNEALVGDFLPQTGAPFGNSSINGNLIGVGLISSDPTDLPSIVTELTANDSTQSIAGLADAVFADSAPLTNQPISASYSDINSTTGRGLALVTGGAFSPTNAANSHASFYLVGPNQFFLIGIDTGSDTSLGVFDPQGNIAPAGGPAGAVASAPAAPIVAHRAHALAKSHAIANAHALVLRRSVNQ